MPQAASSHCCVAPPFRSLPFTPSTGSSRTGGRADAALLVPVLAMVMVPAGLVLAFAAQEVREAERASPAAPQQSSAPG